jgi:hypothetical protein
MNIFNWLFKRNDYKKELFENGSYRLTIPRADSYSWDIITKSKTLVDMFDNYCSWSDITDEHIRLLNEIKPTGKFLSTVTDLLLPLASNHKVSKESRLFINQEKLKITNSTTYICDDNFSLYNYNHLSAGIYVNGHKLIVCITLDSNDLPYVEVFINHSEDIESCNEFIPKEDLPTIVRELTLTAAYRNRELDDERRNNFIKSLGNIENE